MGVPKPIGRDRLEGVESAAHRDLSQPGREILNPIHGGDKRRESRRARNLLFEARRRHAGARDRPGLLEHAEQLTAHGEERFGLAREREPQVALPTDAVANAEQDSIAAGVYEFRVRCVQSRAEKPREQSDRIGVAVAGASLAGNGTRVPGAVYRSGGRRQRDQHSTRPRQTVRSADGSEPSACWAASSASRV